VLGRCGRAFCAGLILAEIAKALRKYVRAGLLSFDLALEMNKEAPRPFATLFPVPPLQIPAFDLACRLNHPAYDCFYLALAKREGVPLVTADKRLASVAKRLPTVEIRLLTGV
jgi:predicted nucleic acid-binding protein